MTRPAWILLTVLLALPACNDPSSDSGEAGGEAGSAGTTGDGGSGGQGSQDECVAPECVALIGSGSVLAVAIDSQQRPVVMYTGTGSEQVAVDAMKSGLDDYILKRPGDMPRLLNAVKRLLEAHAQRTAAQEAEARYRSLYEGVPVGLFRASAQGQILDCNGPLVKIAGAIGPTEQAVTEAETACRLGYDAVLLNSAVAQAHDPVVMARAFKLAIEAGRLAYEAGVMAKQEMAVPTTARPSTISPTK